MRKIGSILHCHGVAMQNAENWPHPALPGVAVQDAANWPHPAPPGVAVQDAE